MKKLLLIVAVSLCFAANTKAQNVVDVLNDVADMAALVSMGTDVLDQSLLIDDKMREARRQIKEINRLMQDEKFWKYTNSALRNRTLRNVQNNARTIQIASVSVKNLLLLTKDLMRQAGNAQGNKTMALIKKIVAKASARAGGVKILGSGYDGANTLGVEAELEDNKYDNASGMIFQGMMTIILKIDEINRIADQILRDAYAFRSQFEASFGIGVLIYHTSNYNLYTQVQKRQEADKKGYKEIDPKQSAAEVDALLKRSENVESENQITREELQTIIDNLDQN